MSRPVLPVDPGKLAEVVGRLWPETARAHGADPGRVAPIVLTDGVLSSDVFGGSTTDRANHRRAIESLSCALDDAGLEVERRGDERRVLGWAASECLPAPGLVRLIDLEAQSPWCSRVRRWRDDLIAARQARAPAAEPDPKRRW